jgi:sulfoxide reductase heme-binding subunit YedZ
MPAIDDNVAAGAPGRSRAYAARTLLVASGLGLVAVVVVSLGARWLVLGEVLRARGTGWLACGMLWLSLCVSPLARLGNRISSGTRGPVSAPVLRRALGMGAAWLALVHALTALAGPVRGDYAAVLGTTHLASGLSALVVLLVLLVTSFDAVLQRLRLRYWKPLHRLAFAAALLVAQHLALSPSCPRWLVVSLACTLVVSLALRALPKPGP